LELVLAEPGALRVLDTASIIGVSKNVRREISKPSVERWIQEAVAANRLQRVVRGLFLNRLIVPPPSGDQAIVLGSGFEHALDYRRATPEAALLHWIYLSSSPRSRMSTPPLDLDLGELDLRRLNRLATAMHLDSNLRSWRACNVVQHA
jgi:hypothetical protein